MVNLERFVVSKWDILKEKKNETKTEEYNPLRPHQLPVRYFVLLNDVSQVMGKCWNTSRNILRAKSGVYTLFLIDFYKIKSDIMGF